MNTTTPTKKTVAGEGGAKGARVQALLAKHPDWSRAQIAEGAECTVARVGEVVRALASKDQAPKPAKAAKATKPAPAKVDEVTSKRDDKDNYAAVMAGQAGDFDAAVAYAKRSKRRVPKRG